MPTPRRAKRRGFVSFQNCSNRKVLSREEFHYWSSFLARTLKISTEIEQNLPSAKHVLAAADPLGGCSKLAAGCNSLGCVHMDGCVSDRHPTMCKTRETGEYLGKKFSCPAVNENDTVTCAGCPAWNLSCRKVECAAFTPYCSVCPSFSRKGEVAENADVRRDAARVREEMKTLLMPTQFVGEVGKSGVLEVKEDGSLLHDGGIEIPTVGRRYHWQSFYNMCKEIMDPLIERGAYVDERCGQHFHVLAGYLPKDKHTSRAISELEKPVPEIIFANLHQLHRRYELAMFWLMSCGTKLAHITRWARYRQTIFPYSALKTKMPGIVQELREKIICMNNSPKDGKYASVAYYLSKFDEQGDVSTFHFENRIADATQSPAVMTAWAALCYALVLKAVRCSQYGIIEVGTKEFTSQVKLMQPKLIDGSTREWGSNRFADTSGLTSEDFSFLRASARELVNFLKPELYKLGPAYAILQSLADKPCSMRLIEGANWNTIEKELMALADGDPSDLTTQIQELIDFSGITECNSIDEWIEEAAAEIGCSSVEVGAAVQSLSDRSLCRWSRAIGSIIAT